MAQFKRYVGIDYSGAAGPTTPLGGLRVCACGRRGPAEEIRSGSSRLNWTRKELAHWLLRQLDGPGPVLIGIDHAFSFPVPYFRRYGLPPSWDRFLDDFCAHWPTDREGVTVAAVRRGAGRARVGDPHWLRETERWTGSAKSVFRFGVTGQVATSTHAGIPWLKFLRTRFPRTLHFWPFDGWTIPEGRSAMAEIYPSLWMRRHPRADRNPDQQAAYATASWLREADTRGILPMYLRPPLRRADKAMARWEGWILGVM